MEKSVNKSRHMRLYIIIHMFYIICFIVLTPSFKRIICLHRCHIALSQQKCFIKVPSFNSKHVRRLTAGQQDVFKMKLKVHYKVGVSSVANINNHVSLAYFVYFIIYFHIYNPLTLVERLINN